MITKIKGELEIDHGRGVIYFHCEDEKTALEYGGITILRIGKLPVIPEKTTLDIIHMHGTDWMGVKHNE